MTTTVLETLNRTAILRSRPDVEQKQVRCAHLVGICGAGMRALAELLTDAGWQVTGSDLMPTFPVSESGRQIRIHQGHSPTHVGADADVLIYSQAVKPSNPERRQAERVGIPQLSYGEMLGALMGEKEGVSIAGTHGKSTTTAMVATMLSACDRAPSVICGAELCDRHASGWSGSGPHFVVESCEYRGTFLNLHPTWAVILDIEADHFDCFPHFEDAVEIYSRFAAQVAQTGLLLVPGECGPAQQVSRHAQCRVETFALSAGFDWQATDIRNSPFGTRCRVFYRGDFFCELLLQVPGRHNVKNALAAAAMGHHLGLSPSEIREGLSAFQGIRRRFEVVGSWKGMTLIDDYAHHPTAVGATLQAARDKFPGRRIWCAFQPHQMSRTSALMDEFSQSFANADEVLIAPVYAAREATDHDPDELSRELSARIAQTGRRSRFLASLDQIVATLDDEAQPGDVLISLGAGDVNQIHHEFARRLQRHHSN